MSRKITLLGMGFIMAVLSVGCSSEAVAPEQEKESRKPATRVEIDLSAKSRQTLTTLEDFNLRVTNDFVKFYTDDEKGTPNAVLSPLSIQMLFSMLANGSDGDFKNDLLEYLGVESVEDLNALASELMCGLPQVDKSADLVLANRAWISDTRTLAPYMAQILTEIYGGAWSYEDYFGNTEKVRCKINEWASEKTKGKIQEVVKIMDPYTLFNLANAMYFKSYWTGEPFDAQLTKDATFNGRDVKATVKMMTAPASLRNYAKYGDDQAFVLDYGNGGFYMTVILPGADNKASVLDADTYKALNHLHTVNLTVNMPKFNVTGESILNNIMGGTALKTLDKGVQLTLFEPEEKCSFDIYHHIYLDVNEEGCEAAAVTITEKFTSPGPGATPEYEDVTVTVDRPFWFFINERSTGACIMSGKINNL